jgi:hypothetical protein
MSAEKALALTHLAPFFSCALSATLPPARLAGVTTPLAVTLLPSLIEPLLRPVSLSVSVGAGVGVGVGVGVGAGGAGGAGAGAAAATATVTT